ncbi:MAG: AMP-binding protein [Bdellovibrionota bacterium]
MSPLTGWLEESLAKHESQIALVNGSARLTYGELNAASQAIAREMLSSGLLSSGRVAIHSDRSLSSIQLILAVLRIGGAYIPIDSRMPDARKADLLKLAQPDLIVGPGCEELSLMTGIPAMSGGADGSGKLSRISNSPASPAYYMFTSGSTGRQKAVEISQSAAWAFAHWAAQFFGLKPGDRVLGLSPLHFDLSTFDLFSVLGSGATLVIAPPALTTFPAQLSEVLEKEQISVFYCVPSLLRMLVSAGRLSERKLPGLRAVLCAGDVFPTEEARTLHKITGSRIFNLYGPTETNVCTAFEWSPAFSGKETPIGTAVAGDKCWVLGDDMREAAAGELVVSGPTLMNGYFQDDEGTRAAFATLANGERGYKTGDLVKRDKNGLLWFVGRRSGIIKTYGYRIHPAEVEAAIRNVPSVADCVVFGEADPRAGQLLHAVLVLRDPGVGGPEDVTSELLSVLPSPMIPGKFTVVPSIPYLSNGKIDRELAAKRAAKPVPSRARLFRGFALLLLLLAIGAGRKIYFHFYKSGTVVIRYSTGKPEIEEEWRHGKLNGLRRSFYASGQLREECPFTGGKRNGVCRIWYPTGKLKTEFQFENGKLAGVWREFFPGSDQLLWQEHYKDGKKDGTQVFFYSGGQKKEQRLFSRDLAEGEWISWYPNGKLKSRGAFHEGKEQGEWKKWREDGHLTFTQEFQAGKPHGLSRTFFDSGRVHDECSYTEGQRNGYCRVYYPSGKVESEEQYLNDKKDGLIKAWSETGRLIYSAGYKGGALEGLKSAWDPAGKLIAQEDYHDGHILRVIKKNDSGFASENDPVSADSSH